MRSRFVETMLSTIARTGIVVMDRLLHHFLSKFVRRGTISFTTAGGSTFTCGDGTGTPVKARFLTKSAEIRILLHPELALGEAFMDGSFVVEQGSIADILAVLMDQPDVLPDWAKPQHLLARAGFKTYVDRS